MKYKRKKSSLSKYVSSAEQKGRRVKISGFKKFVITFSVLAFVFVSLLNSGILKIENSKTAKYINSKTSAISTFIDKKSPILSKVGRAGAEFCFGYLRNVSDDNQKAFADEGALSDGTVEMTADSAGNTFVEETEAVADNESEFEPIFPCQGRISSPYGERLHPISGQGDFHNGIDIAAVLGTEIKAIEDGVVEKCEYNQYSGNFAVIRHNDSTTSSYAHMAKAEVTTGQKVKKGDIIGIVGNTGSSTGPHLHMEIRIDKNPVNPMNYLK